MKKNIAKTDCFAFRNETKKGCNALTHRVCNGCSFYKKDEIKRDCFAFKSECVCDGCDILEIRKCTNCAFYKTEEQKNADLKKAFEKVLELPDYIRSNIKDLYEECGLEESDVGGVLV